MGSDKETAVPGWEQVQEVVVLAGGEGMDCEALSGLEYPFDWSSRGESCLHRLKGTLVWGVRSSEGIVLVSEYLPVCKSQRFVSKAKVTQVLSTP